MITIKITFDPYHMNTALNIDGQNVKKVARGFERIHGFVEEKIPLQSWIDPIPFQGWNGLLLETVGNSYETEVEFHFRGREIDFFDFKEAIERQSKKEFNGQYDIKVSFPNPKFIYDDHAILEQAKAAYELILSEDFKKILDDELFELGNKSDSKCAKLKYEYEVLPNKFAAAMDGEFRIVFSGMYTCGKSTIINAILGRDILPTRDGTCTSKVFKIQNDTSVSFARMSCVDKDGNIVVEEEEYDETSLREKFEVLFPRGTNDELLPSNPPTIDMVLISTDMSSLYPEDASYNEKNMRLVIVDTPGTSSGEGNMLEDGQAHCDITQRVIESDEKEMVIFATSAIEDKDDSIQKFLDMVDENDPQGAYDQRFLFVLNKADACSLKSGETWEQKLRGIRNYYVGNKERSIRNPRFFPTSALGALEIRTGRVKGADYKGIEAKYYFYDDDREAFVQSETKSNYHFDEICSTSQAIKDKISTTLMQIKESELKASEKRKKEIELHSGIVSLEMAIRDYIEKYAFPLKMQELLKSYETIFKETEQLVKKTSTDFDEAVKAREDAESKKKFEEENKTASEETKKSLVAVFQAIEEKKKRLEEIASTFSAEVKKQTTELKIDMDLAIEKAKKEGESRPKAKEVKRDIQKIIDETAEKCREKINSKLADSRKQTKELENEINSFFREIEAMVNFGKGFEIGNTTDFQTISTESISKIRNNRHEVRNPELDQGFFLFRPIKNLFLEKTIWQDDGINKEELKAKLTDIRFLFDTKIDETFIHAEMKLDQAVSELKENLDTLGDKIKEHADRITKIKDKIGRIVKDINEKASTEAKLSSYNNLLTLILKYTEFDHVEEME